MGTPDQLDDRKAAILRAVVEAYVETAQPVGSQAIASSSKLGVSSATVRNEMTVLEREGYLVQPHTSAGRVPTDRGYRYFVDHFTGPGGLPEAPGRAISDFFGSAHQALEDLLDETSQLLARVSRHASVVVGPSSDDAAVVRGVQLVLLQPRQLLVVLVLSTGTIEKQLLHLERDTDDLHVTVAEGILDRQLVGSAWSRLPELAVSGDAVADELARLARDSLARAAVVDGGEPVYVGGVSRLAAEQEAFPTVQSAARLLELLEHQVIVVTLVRELLDAGVNVSIGSENRSADLRDCSIVLAPYEVDGVELGVVGVLGPTRMDYRHALAAVSAVSQQLGRHLS